MFTRILVPVDGTPESSVALSPARTLAESAVFSRIPSPLRTIRAISRALGFLRQPDE